MKASVTNTRSTTIYWIGFVILLAFGCYCIYAAIFFGWVASVSHFPAQRQQATALCNAWSWALLAALVGFLVISVRIFFVLRSRRSAGGSTMVAKGEKS